MHCRYYVAFFDKDGKLLGCAGQGTFDKKGLRAGESTQLGSCLIPLPAGLHEKAVQYKIAFYESDKEIGKEHGRDANRRAERSLRLQPGGATAAGSASLGQTTWYSAGPGWKELSKVANVRGISLSGRNHDAAGYAYILANSQPGSTVVLLFALDDSDKTVPADYADLLPMPWDQIQAALQKGETLERVGQARGRRIVLLAAPKEWQLNKLIHTTKLLP
jgi:hypothetical protein